MSPSAEAVPGADAAISTIHHRKQFTPRPVSAAAWPSTKAKTRAASNIIDIRRASVELNLRDMIKEQFCPKSGPRTLPTLLLYDDKGLQLFEEVSILFLFSFSFFSLPNLSSSHFPFFFLYNYYPRMQSDSTLCMSGVILHLLHLLSFLYSFFLYPDIPNSPLYPTPNASCRVRNAWCTPFSSSLLSPLSSPLLSTSRHMHMHTPTTDARSMTTSTCMHSTSINT